MNKNNRTAYFPLILVAFLVISSGCADTTNRANLKPVTRDLRRVIHKFEGRLKENDFQDIKELKLDLMACTSLKGIELCGNLESLEIKNLWRVDDIKPLGKLKKLKHLEIDNFDSVDLSPISEIKTLESLSLLFGHEINIYKIEGLDKLKSLDISSVRIIGFDPGFVCPNLEYLYMQSKYFPDISMLHRAPSLKSLIINRDYPIDLSILNEEAYDISSLSNLKELETLDFGFSQIKNIDVIAGLTNLKKLHIGIGPSNKHLLPNLPNLELLDTNTACLSEVPDPRRIKELILLPDEGDNLDILDKFENLEILHLHNFDNVSLSVLYKLKKLRVLNLFSCEYLNLNIDDQLPSLRELRFKYLRNCQIYFPEINTNIIKLEIESCDLKQFFFLSNLINVKEMDITDTGRYILDLSFLSTMQDLEILRLKKDEISGDENISSLVRLRELYISSPNGTKDIISIGFIQFLKKLEKLHLESESIFDLSPISELYNLQELNLNSNNIEDISALANLKNLKILNLNDNQIVDISPLRGLSSLEIIELRRNKIKDISPLLDLNNLAFVHISNNPLKRGQRRLVANRLRARGTVIYHD